MIVKIGFLGVLVTGRIQSSKYNFWRPSTWQKSSSVSSLRSRTSLFLEYRYATSSP